MVDAGLGHGFLVNPGSASAVWFGMEPFPLCLPPYLQSRVWNESVTVEPCCRGLSSPRCSEAVPDLHTATSTRVSLSKATRHLCLSPSEGYHQSNLNQNCWASGPNSKTMSSDQPCLKIKGFLNYFLKGGD